MVFPFRYHHCAARIPHVLFNCYQFSTLANQWQDAPKPVLLVFSKHVPCRFYRHHWPRCSFVADTKQIALLTWQCAFRNDCPVSWNVHHIVKFFVWKFWILIRSVFCVLCKCLCDGSFLRSAIIISLGLLKSAVTIGLRTRKLRPPLSFRVDSIQQLRGRALLTDRHQFPCPQETDTNRAGIETRR
jgi:hypothetical protein